MLKGFHTLLLASVCLIVLFTGCGKDDKKGGDSKVTKDNFAKLKDTMTEKEVVDILGEPSKTKDIQGGKELNWESGSNSITIGFLNGKVAYKSNMFVEVK